MNTKSEKYPNSANLNAGTDFPYTVLDVIDDVMSSRQNEGFRIMRWHDDLQFIFVWDGIVELRTLTESLRIAPGEGAFINRGVIHRVGRDGPCHYTSILFPERFLWFYPECPAQAPVERIVGNDALAVLKLASQTPWEKRALDTLRELAALRRDGMASDEEYAYRVLVLLARTWLEIATNIEPTRRAGADVRRARVRDALSFMEARYSEALSLSDLADAAHVSVSELGRDFRACLGTTPWRYLTEYRLDRAARLLRATRLPVATVAARTGFASPSHFGKLFRERTGLSPRAYRAEK